jgi:hypothetical protein
MSSTAWLTRRSVSLCLSEHSPARSHRSDEPTTRDSPGRCSAPDLRVVPRVPHRVSENELRVVASGTDAVRPNRLHGGLASGQVEVQYVAIPSYSLGEH